MIAWVGVRAIDTGQAGVMGEIGEDAHSRASLHLPAQTLAEMVDSAVQAIVVHRGRLPLFINRATLVLTAARSWEEICERPVSEWMHPEDRGRVMEYVRRRLADPDADVPANYQFRIFRLDGAERWVDCYATTIPWPDGDPAIVASLFDITAQKRAEEERSRSETLFARVFAASPEMMALIYADTGLFLDVNPQFAKVFGLSREQILGQSVFDLGLWAEPTMPLRIRAAIRRHGSIRDREAEGRRADGTRFPMRFSVERLEVDHREVLLLIARDVSEEKRRERELRESRDAAELANRTKSAFLANISHELRTPLNAIIGFSEILMQAPFGPLGDRRYQEYAQDIHRSGQHLLAVISDILDISKVEAGKVRLNEEEVDLAESVAQVARIVHPRASEAGLTLVTSTAGKPVPVMADARLIKQILFNLLSNAIKFTPAGGRVEVRSLVDERGCPVIEVADSGIGMSREEIAIALQPFEQVDNAFTRRHEGTGLGLPLVQAFARAHGGELELISERDRGTLARVVLPADRLVRPAREGHRKRAEGHGTV